MRKKRMSVCILAMAITMSGCGNGSAGDIPTLMEPAATTEAYRPVELGHLDKTEIEYGTVVANTYCSFFSTSQEIRKIVVEVGDQVQEGDIVAYADVDAAKERLEELNADLDNENQNYSRNVTLSQLRVEKLQNAPAEEGQDHSVAIATQQENARYDGILHEYRVKKLKEAIAEEEKIVNDGTLKARHSGVVSFTKNIGSNSSAAAYENIVIVSDLEDTFIELNEVTIGGYKYADYQIKYLLNNGKRHDVTELSYSTEERVISKASGKYPNVRLTCEGVDMKIGDTYAIYYGQEDEQDLPMIGRDSLYGEKDAYYVYVAGEDGIREKRDVVIHEMDEHYATVVGGLEEGELVAYSSESVMPVEYEEYTVERSTYTIENKTATYGLAGEQSVWSVAPKAGTLLDLQVKKGDEVEAGALLYRVDSGEGKAALMEAKNQITHEDTDYEDEIKKLDQSIATETDPYESQILAIQKELATINHNYRRNKLQKAYDELGENNDGNGVISVYAKQSGKISALEVKEGKKVDMMEPVLSITSKGTDTLLVQMAPIEDEKSYETNIADMGEAITIEVGDDTFTGQCVGWAVHNKNNVQKAYLCSDEDGAYVSYSTESGYSYPSFYVKMDDESFYTDLLKGQVTFLYLSMPEALVVASGLVHEEKVMDSTDYYVWKIREGELVKQYVTIDESLSDVSHTLILSGIDENDVLAKEK